jgi:ribosomal-protein-alanine N-acetyltransferase
MVPTADDIERWVGDARSRGATCVRTGALFPESAPSFTRAGFEPIDRLTLLSLELSNDHRFDSRRSATGGIRLRRLRASGLDVAAHIDRRSFDPPWADDAAALGDILSATPQHRARCAVVDGEPLGFAITGRAGSVGYVQRLAVDPEARRRGVATALLGDSLRWLARRHVRTALVNTATDNDAALALYARHGFAPVPGELVIAERVL